MNEIVKKTPGNQVLIVTCAGKATRFTDSLIECGLPVVHKCIAEAKPGNYLTSPLGRLLHLSIPSYSHIIIVTGYKHEDVELYVNKRFGNSPFIEMVYNKDWNLGSVRSIQTGLEAAQKYIKSEQFITFVEGDLLFDEETFCKIVESDKEIITHVNRGIIDMNKAVVCLIADYKPYWRYSSFHKGIDIDVRGIEKIFESGQVWKFKVDEERLTYRISDCKCANDTDTNLVPLNNRAWDTDFQILTWKKWANVNTITDLNDFFHNGR